MSIRGVFLWFFLSVLPLRYLVAQGPLIPPDPPGPSMRTLTQVEPRIPIEAPTEITVSDAYYLTCSLGATSGMPAVRIAADQVTLDLNGFAIQGDGTAPGIMVDGAHRGLTIVDGCVHGCTIGLALESAADVRVANVQVHDNTQDGLVTGERALVRACQAWSNASDGIQVGESSLVLHCFSGANGDDGVELRANGTVEACTLTDNAYGLYAAGGALARNCAIHTNRIYGVLATDHSAVENCVLIGNASGIRCNNRCRIERNLCLANVSGAAIQGISANRITANTCWEGPIGIQLTGERNTVEDNSVAGHADNYDVREGNRLNLVLSEVPEALEWPCRVRLAHDLESDSSSAHAILVQANNVTIDLGGYALSGVGAVGIHGIKQGLGYKGLTVRRGTVSGFDGVGAAGLYLEGGDGRLEDVSAIDNTMGFVVASNAASAWAFAGCVAKDNNEDGFHLYRDAVLEACVAHSNGVQGLACYEGGDVRACLANGNGGDGILVGNGGVVHASRAEGNGATGIVGLEGSRLIDCAANGNGADGLEGRESSLISGCVASTNGLRGIRAKTGSIVRNCVANGNGSHGISPDSYVTIEACTMVNNAGHGLYGHQYDVVIGCRACGNGISDTGAGISVWQGCAVRDNVVMNNDVGIRATGVRNLIVRNNALNNTTNFDLVAQNAVGEAVVTPMSPAVTGSTGGSGVGSTDPWANFSH